MCLISRMPFVDASDLVRPDDPAVEDARLVEGPSFLSSWGDPAPDVASAGTHRLHNLPHNPNGHAQEAETDSEAAEDA
jgi:hypothetical protein